jgi:hypothetical protein
LTKAHLSKGGVAKPPVYGIFLGQRGCQCEIAASAALCVFGIG